MAGFSYNVSGVVGAIWWGHEMEKDFGWHPNDMLIFMATFLKNVLLLFFLLYSPPNIYPPNMFITFLLLRSSKLRLWMCHSEQLCLSFIFPLINATKFCRHLWFFLLLARVSSANLTKAQVCISTYHTSWFQQLHLPGDCQGTCAISLLKITHYLSNVVEGRKDSQGKENPHAFFTFPYGRSPRYHQSGSEHLSWYWTYNRVLCWENWILWERKRKTSTGYGGNVYL